MRGNYWEQRKLGEITSSYSGGTPQANNPEYYNGSIPFIRSAEINADKTELFLSEKGLLESSAVMVDVGCILYALYGATSGEVGISRVNGAINQAVLAIYPSEGFDTRFLASWLRREKGTIVATYLQGGQGNLSGAIIKNLELPVPRLPEQQAIGNCLACLDSLITLHQREGISAYKEAFVLTHQRNKFVRDVILLRLLLPGTIHAVKRMVLLIHPLRPAILASAEHEDSSSAGTGKLVIVPERDDFVRIAENLLALLIHTGVFRYRMGKVNLGTSQNRKPTRVLVVFTNALDAIASRMEHRANLGPSINSIKVETQGGHPEQHVIVQSLDVVFGIWAHVRFGNF